MADDIDFTVVMAEKCIKVFPAVCALFDDADTLFICLSQEVVLEDLMDLPRVGLEVGSG